MTSGIRLEPAGIDRSASAAAARALALDEVAGAITSTSLAGLEPSTVARTVGALERATKLTQRASGITGHQGPRLRKRAELARRADAGGASLIKPWDPLKWAQKISLTTLDQYSALLDAEKKALKAGGAKALRGGKSLSGMYYRRRFRSWQALQKHYKKTVDLRAERTKLLKQLDRINLKRRAIEEAKRQWQKRFPPKKTPSFFGKLGGKALKVAGKAVGPVTAVASSIAKGEPFETTIKRAGAAAVALGVEVVITGAGAAACAAVTVGSMGPGAAACPAIIGVTAAGASIAAGAVINHQIDKHAEPHKPKPKPAPRVRPAGRCAVPSAGAL